MRILWNNIVGGYNIRITLIIVFISLLQSCDTGYLLTFRNNKEKKIEVVTPTGNLEIHCSYFCGHYYLVYNLKGEYEINPDSLRLETNSNDVKINYNMPMNGSVSYRNNKTQIRNKSISVKLILENDNYSFTPLVLSILPSYFITSNGKQVLYDTLKVELPNQRNFKKTNHKLM